MSWKQPPGMATWLLKHFGSGPNNEAVLGDLGEQYQHTGDALRYWRQASKPFQLAWSEMFEHTRTSPQGRC